MSVIGKVENHLGLSTTLGDGTYDLEHLRHEDSIGWVKRERITLTPTETTGVMTTFWENKSGATVIVYAAYVHVTTVATAACTLDIGVAANGTTGSDTLMDGIDVNTATGIFDSILNKGTNGNQPRLVLSTEFVTVETKTGDDTGLVSTLEVHWGIA